MNRFYNALAIAAVILTPVAMMAALGWTAYGAILAETGWVWLAIAAGIATAAAVECIGIVAGETALQFHGRGDRRWLIAAVILISYVAFGVVILRDTALSLLPIMAGLVYVLVGLRAQAQREEEAARLKSQRDGDALAAQTSADAEWKREQWRIQQADRTRIKLAELETHTSTEPALSQHTAPIAGSTTGSMPAQSYVCEDCGDKFGSQPALNAHRRFCKGIPAALPVEERQNGHHVEELR